ncbi:6-dideoxygalactose transaminase [Pseudomonas sp. S31]|uniref:dTDP-4-amino-4,6-dideoxygalactose transaminase n=1 Tax=Pseudomonas sp. S31 TaxID=1564473 RepID=UPI0019146595|nr:dTDP-4-amino-4,6-dideoxygalactose transaminase [Pseudomonas sp. S31]MBK5002886.1 6-dideoxygalactose transaminase [Pseudomonas sp. S31]
MITFNRPPYTGNEDKYVLESMRSGKISGDGEFSKRCQDWFEERLGCKKALLTPSCTHALEMAAILLDIGPGDEVIMPSYTFVSTANAFALRGAKVVFVDVRPDTMNLDEKLIEKAITSATKAIVVVHYAGVSCDMDAVMSLARARNLYVVEDAAQGMMSTFKGKPLGTIGHIGAYSFHETKNYTSAGEGGLLIINDEQFAIRAEVIREKGTNRSQFFRGMVDKYSWVDLGSSYLPSDVQAAYLWGQLEKAEEIYIDRMAIWDQYYNLLSQLADDGSIELPKIPNDCSHNAHMFYIKVKGLEVRTDLIAHLKRCDVMAVFHYIPLHTAPAGKIYSRFEGEDIFTTQESERLVRLPIWYGMPTTSCQHVAQSILDFFK